MRIDFKDKKLARICADGRSRRKAFGKVGAKRLGDRLSTIKAASNLEELRNAPGRYHELRADRAGQFAADLDHPYRLIFKPVLTAEEESLHAAGFVWAKITHVLIIEITDYHG